MKGTFYKIDGSGGCNGCSEFWGAYTLQGTLLTEFYYRRSRFDYRFGNLNKLYKRYGVDSLESKKYDVDVVSVFPPQLSGQKGKSLVR